MVGIKVLPCLLCCLVGYVIAVGIDDPKIATMNKKQYSIPLWDIGNTVPGFKTTISQDFLNYADQVGISVLLSKFGTIPIPDLSGTAGTPIGNIDWYLTNIVLGSLAIPQSSITLVPNVGFTISIGQLSCAVTMDWSYRQESWPHTSDSGTADISVSQTSVSVELQLTVSGGRIQVAVASCSVSIGNLDITLHGGASWLYNIFISILQGDITNAIQQALQNAISTSIGNGINQVLDGLPLQVPVGPLAVIDYSMVGNPTVTSTYLTLPANGEFYADSNPTECPASVCPTPAIPDTVTSDMVQMIISEYVPNSAGYVFFELGKLTINVTDQDLPSWSPVRLNTKSFQYLLPQLYKKYPNMPMVLDLVAGKPPQLTFGTSGAYIEQYGYLKARVVPSNGTELPAFTLGGEVTATGIAILSGTAVYGNVTYVKANFSVVSSQIGPFSANVFTDLVNLLLSDGIIPAINAYLKTGINLPVVPGLTFVSPYVGYGNGYISISTDITYTPPAEKPPSLSPLANPISIN